MSSSPSFYTVLKVVMIAMVGAAIWSYTMPLLELKVPPLVTKKISAWQLTQPIVKAVTPKGGAKKASKKGKFKIDGDFYDVLEKILPQNKKTGKTNKFSFTFVLGALVPVSIITSYLLIFLIGLTFMLSRFKILITLSGAAVVLSTYALAGTYYLGKAAQAKFQGVVAEKSAGLLGAVAKHFVSEITIKPDLALYVLFGLALGVWMTNMLSFAGKK